MLNLNDLVIFATKKKYRDNEKPIMSSDKVTINFCLKYLFLDDTFHELDRKELEFLKFNNALEKSKNPIELVCQELRKLSSLLNGSNIDDNQLLTAVLHNFKQLNEYCFNPNGETESPFDPCYLLSQNTTFILLFSMMHFIRELIDDNQRLKLKKAEFNRT